MARKSKPSGRKLPDKGKKTKRRISGKRPLRPRLLIVCEGGKTEPNYFKSFRVNADVEVQGVGRNTLSLVEYAHELQEDAEKEGQPYTKIWVVFDRDDFLPHNFNAAIQQAQNKAFGVAYSNESFELWYVLHFEYLNSAISRQQYLKKLSKNLGQRYRKNDITMYRRLLPRQSTAIQNAKKLFAFYQPKHNPATDSPCTTVHHLVQELNRYLR